MYVSLAPCHVDNPINGIKAQHLDPLIMTYYSKGQGIILSYFNVSIKDATDDEQLIAKVTDSSAFAFMWITVDLLLWHPEVGDTLEGHVYIQTASHIGLLVHDTFNASIKYRNIPQDWEFVPSQADEYAEAEEESSSKPAKLRSFGYWLDGSGTKVEGKLQFTVKAIYTAGRMLSLEGSLVSPEAELDAQPVMEERRDSSITAAPASGKHITFGEDTPAELATPELSTPAEVPGYEDTKTSANSSSSEADESD